MWGELHEVKLITISLPKTLLAGEGNRLLRQLGATLYYDTYSFDAEKSENWQSECLLNLDLKNNGVTVDAQDDFNEIVVSYPFASRPSSDQPIALRIVENIIVSLNGTGTYQSAPFSMEIVQKDWDLCNDFLLKEWGEEPGSKELLRMIEENYA